MAAYCLPCREEVKDIHIQLSRTETGIVGYTCIIHCSLVMLRASGGTFGYKFFFFNKEKEASIICVL